MKMNRIGTVIVSGAMLAIAGSAAAQCEIDQNQPNSPAYMAAFSQTDLAQSFQHQADNAICGAGIFLQPAIGSSDNVHISLWDALPNQGGTMLAEGSEQGTAGQWVDVFWSPVNISANTTYYLVFDGNMTLGIAGDTSNPYPHGQVYANPGYNPFPTFDYTFRTYSETGDCLSMTVSALAGGQQGTWDISDATPGATGVVVYGFAPGQTTVNGTAGYCATFGIQGVNQNKVVGFWRADGNGDAQVKKMIPRAATGRRVLTQAAEKGTCPDECVSNVDTQTVG